MSEIMRTFAPAYKKNLTPKFVFILKYIMFLGYDKDDLLFGLDVMPDAVQGENRELPD